MTHEELKEIILRVIEKMKTGERSAEAACIFGDKPQCLSSDVCDVCDVCDTCDVTTYYAVGEED